MTPAHFQKFACVVGWYKKLLPIVFIATLIIASVIKYISCHAVMCAIGYGIFYMFVIGFLAYAIYKILAKICKHYMKKFQVDNGEGIVHDPQNDESNKEVKD